MKNFGGKIAARFPKTIARWATRLRCRFLVAWALNEAARQNPYDAGILAALDLVNGSNGPPESVLDYREARARERIEGHLREGNVTGVLECLAEYEFLQREAPLEAGRLVVNMLTDMETREKLFESARVALSAYGNSAYLIHLTTFGDALAGDYRAASALLTRKMRWPGRASRSLAKARRLIHKSSWRVVDKIAHEHMDWSDDWISDQAAGAADEAPLEGAKAALSFKEILLQGRMREEYLAACEADLLKARAISGRLAAIRDMLRIGTRHIPDYGPSYARAREALEAQAGELDSLFQPEAVETPEAAKSAVANLCGYLTLARRLNMTVEAERILNHLSALSRRKDLGQALWPAPAAIAADDADMEVANRIMGRIADLEPQTNRDIADFFQWAGLAQRFEEADAFYARLPEGFRRHHGLLHHVNNLQRQGRFQEAFDLLQEVYARHMAIPAKVNAFTSRSLIRRTGELSFILKTAELLARVPQPRAPKGVVLIAPRNVDQLRRYPLMVLIEMRRRGWAVVPMVAGLLPREETGIPDIDVMNGAINPNLQLSDEARAVMPELVDFNFDPGAGRLTWGRIDLSHSLWEDSAANRRRYTIFRDCPELNIYLGNLAKWTRRMGQVLEHARQIHCETGRRIATISLFNNRLPDSLFRSYCAEFGDPDRFFHLHAANGYQNYFTNFSTNISRRFVLRNTTRHNDVRSASFPLPENFDRYYIEQQHRLPEILERFAPITKVKRSTGDAKGRAPEAAALDERIATWRAGGGHVACAFGKVVCDSGVPFDGGPVHASMKEWINHCVRAVQGSRTLLLIKPHPHEVNNQIASFPTETFEDLISEPLGENAVFMGHRWFDMDDMRSRMDLGLIYNGTTTIELGIMGIPALLAGHFAPIDYPIGHTVAKTREEFEARIRFEIPTESPPDIRERAAVWLDYMASEDFTQPYRFHTRPVTNKVLYPPYWFEEDLAGQARGEDRSIEILTGRAIDNAPEPGGVALGAR